MQSLSLAKRKFFARLQEKKFRDAEHLFVAEGLRTVRELLQHPRSQNNLVALLITTAQAETFSIPQSFTTRSFAASAADLRAICDTSEPQGIVGIFRQLVVEKEHVFASVATKPRALIIALDGLQDPGNVGTVIRTAAWFGIDAMIASAATADFFNPKTVRAAAGSLYALPLIRSTSLANDLATLKLSGFTFYAAALEGMDVRGVRPAEKSLVMIGNEGNGIAAELLGAADVKIKIEGDREAVESLNAAVAAGILMSLFAK